MPVRSRMSKRALLHDRGQGRGRARDLASTAAALLLAGAMLIGSATAANAVLAPAQPHGAGPAASAPQAEPGVIVPGITAVVHNGNWVGQKFEASVVGWAPADVEFAYQWYSNFTPIPGATSSTYVPTDAEALGVIYYVVTATKPGYEPASRASPSYFIRGLVVGAPVQISGNPVPGEMLTASSPGWTPSDATLHYSWYREGSEVAISDDPSYRVIEADLGERLSVVVTGQKDYFVSDSAQSEMIAPTGVMVPGDLSVSGTPQVGQTLTASSGAWQPSDVSVSYQWFRGATPIPGAASASYVVTADDPGENLTVQASGAKQFYTPVVVTSAAVTGAGMIEPGVLEVTGQPIAGTQMQASSSGWKPASVSVAYQWFADGSPIAGATSAQLDIPANAAGKKFRVVATATKPHYTAGTISSAVFDGLGVITPGTVRITGFTDTAAPGQILTAEGAGWQPDSVTLSYQWLRDGEAIAGAHASTYQVTRADLSARLTVQAIASAPDHTDRTADLSDPVGVRGVLTPGEVTVTGVAHPGHTLTAQTNAWSETDVTLSYQWLRGTEAIVGATSADYLLTAADVGAKVTLQVTGTKKDFAAAMTTSNSVSVVGVITPGGLELSGNPNPGETLTVTPVGWAPENLNYSYVWLRDLKQIAGADHADYVVTNEDLGAEISVRVAAQKEHYLHSAWLSSNVMTGFGLITPGTIDISGTPTEGETLTAVAAGWAPEAVEFGYQWYRGAERIADATGSTYVVTAADAGVTVSVVATGSLANYRTSGPVASPGYAGAGLITPGAVTISGESTVGSVLSAKTAGWLPEAIEYGYQWFRDGAEIPTATASEYEVSSADIGAQITVQIIGSQPGYVTSPAVASAAVSGVGVMTSGGVSVLGKANPGETLTVETADWAPENVEFSYQWIVEGAPIATPDKRAEAKDAELSGASFALTEEHIGASITVVVTGSAQNHAPIAPVSSEQVTVLGLIGAGTVVATGTPNPGKTLTAEVAGFAPQDVELTYAWQRDDATIAGATGAAYTLTDADLGAQITVSAKASKRNYEESAVIVSAAVQVVAGPQKPKPPKPGTTKPGTTKPGEPAERMAAQGGLAQTGGDPRLGLLGGTLVLALGAGLLLRRRLSAGR